MKKLCLLTLGLLATASISAQVTLLKDADKAFKGADDYKKYKSAEQLITPAFTNEETAKNPQTYWIPGKQAFKLYDDAQLQQQLGKDVNLIEMGEMLMNGYRYGLKAMDNDSLPDAKGKVKPKYSKEISGLIAGHLNDFINVGSAFWDKQKYPEAYEAFIAYTQIPENPRYGSVAPKAPADTMTAQILYYAGLAAWQGEMLPQAADAFERMMKMGYNDMQAYDYAYSVAYQLGDEAKKLEYSQIAFDKWGNAKPDFLQRIIQSYINAKEYDKAMATLQNAISSDPNNANYYYLLGVLYDDQNNKEKSMELFKKALDLDPAGPLYNFSYGTALLQKIERLEDSDAVKNMSTPEYNKYRVETLNPIYRESASYLEKAYELDPDNMRNALTNLKIIYYNLNDGDNLKRVEGLM